MSRDDDGGGGVGRGATLSEPHVEGELENRQHTKGDFLRGHIDDDEAGLNRQGSFGVEVIPEVFRSTVRPEAGTGGRGAGRFAEFGGSMVYAPYWERISAATSARASGGKSSRAG